METEPQIMLAYVTFPDPILAKQAAEKLVSQNCAAGVNILGGVQSVFHWQGKLCQREEWILFAQTTKQAFPDFQTIIKNIHSDSVPCILGLPISLASPAFRNWILENCPCDPGIR